MSVVKSRKNDHLSNNYKDFLTLEGGIPSFVKWNALVKESMDYAFKYGTDFLFHHPGVVDPYVGRASADPTLSREVNKFLVGETTAKQALIDTGKAWRDMLGIK